MMRLTVSSLAFFFCLLCLDVSSEALGRPDKPVPSKVPYYHNWVDNAGVSHIAACQFTNWTYVDLLNNTDPNFVDNSESASPATFVLLQSPPAWVGGWHKNPYPQLVIFVQGTASFTAMDGTTFNFTVGDIYFGEDQLSTKGHLTKNIGNGPLTLAFVQFRTWQPTINLPCRLV
jgi:hypothetical protein